MNVWWWDSCIYDCGIVTFLIRCSSILFSLYDWKRANRDCFSHTGLQHSTTDKLFSRVALRLNASSLWSSAEMFLCVRSHRKRQVNQRGAEKLTNNTGFFEWTYWESHSLLSLQVNIFKSRLLLFKWQHLPFVRTLWSHLQKQPGYKWDSQSYDPLHELFIYFIFVIFHI